MKVVNVGAFYKCHDVLFSAGSSEDQVCLIVFFIYSSKYGTFQHIILGSNSWPNEIRLSRLPEFSRVFLKSNRIVLIACRTCYLIKNQRFSRAVASVAGVGVCLKIISALFAGILSNEFYGSLQ